MVSKKEVAFALQMLIMALQESGSASLHSTLEYEGKDYEVTVKGVSNADSNTVS